MNRALTNVFSVAVILIATIGCDRILFAESTSLALLRSKLHDGDIIFKQSQTSQSVALREATGSPWTHMGIVLLDRNDLRVLEAGMNGVAYASLDSFVGRSRERRVIVKRLRDEGRLTSDARARMHASLRGDLGKDYDNLFEWSDKKIYCSELIWRAYERGLGLSLGHVQRMRDLRYDRPAVQKLIRERFHLHGSEIQTSALLDEQVVTPISILSSNVLVTVFDGIVTQ